MSDIYNPQVKLPIEGHTVWPNVMRLMVIGTLVTGFLFCLVFLLMIPPEQINIKPDRLFMALACFVFFEVAVVRLLIIPVSGDYGRYRINQANVEFYPLSTLGMSVMPRAQMIPMSDFKGIHVQPTIFSDGVSRAYVTLVHPQSSNSVRIKLFSAEAEAKAYADNLAKVLSTQLV